MSGVARLVLAELADDPDALAELRKLLADETPHDNGLLSPAEVATRLGVSPRTVNRWAAAGRLSAIKVGRGWRFEPDALHLAPAPVAEPAVAPPRLVRRRVALDAPDPSSALLDLARRRA